MIKTIEMLTENLKMQKICQAKLGIFIADPAYRDKDIGKYAIQQMISLAKSDGIDIITLNVRVGNLRARKVYSSCGFKEKKNYNNSKMTVISGPVYG